MEYTFPLQVNRFNTSTDINFQQTEGKPMAAKLISVAFFLTLNC